MGCGEVGGGRLLPLAVASEREVDRAVATTIVDSFGGCDSRVTQALGLS